MNKLLRLLSLFSALYLSQTVSSFAQTPDEIRCASNELLQQQLLLNPELANQIKQQEKFIDEWIKNHKDEQTRDVITIPVVVHLVYNPAVNRIFTDWEVKAQIDVLNEDYRRMNGDAHKTPDAFQSVARDCEIQFCLARRDPDGNFTTGILRETYNDVDEWMMGSFDNNYKVTAWDRNRYLNIWVARMAQGQPIGWSTFPSTTDFTDGCVVAEKAFSRIDPQNTQIYTEGRTATHEVGHWLNLYHPSGDDSGSCNGTDHCDDTPNQGDNTFGCPEFPELDNCAAASPGIMYMNFMDYVHDTCMNLFTNDQRLRMLAALNTQRTSLLTSNGCNIPGNLEHDLAIVDILKPVVIVNTRYFNPVVRVANYGTQPVSGFKVYFQFYEQGLHELDIDTTLQPNESADIVLTNLRDSIGYNFFIAYVKNSTTFPLEMDTVNNYMTRSFFVPDTAAEPGDNVIVGPNPSDGLYNVYFDSLVEVGFEMDVFNILGQKVPVRVLYFNPYFNKIQFEIPAVSTGFYFLRIRNNKKQTAFKLIHQPVQ